MSNIPLYSLVIFPDEQSTLLVKSFKELLLARIKWFGSANAAAHITVMNFWDDAELNQHYGKIRTFCQSAVAQCVRFNSFDSFGDRTFFIAPDPGSKKYLNELIRSFHQAIGYQSARVEAHITVARSLDTVKMAIAKELFNDISVDFDFNCHALFLRKFDGKQYSVITEKFEFSGVKSPDLFDT